MEKTLWSWKWLVTTLLVIAACAIMVRLGLWQLDRLESRRAFNARVQAQLDQGVLDLNQSSFSSDFYNMEYRSVVVVGEFLHEEQIAIRNQAYEDQIGLYLVTPLKIAGTNQSILVNRGWIPIEDTDPENWSKYDEPGMVQVEGLFRRSITRPEIGSRNDPAVPEGQKLHVWNLLNVSRIEAQVSTALLPVYLQQAPDPNWTRLPYRSEPQLDLTEGPHLGYAGQWFIFALILGIGYPIYIQRQFSGKKQLTPAMVRRK